MTDSTPVRRVRLRSGLTEIGAPMGETIPTYQDYVLGEDFDRVQAENVRLKGELETAAEKFSESQDVLVSDLAMMEAERDSLRAQLAARDERIRGLEEAQTSMYAEGKRFEGLWRESAQQLAAALAKVEEAERDAGRLEAVRKRVRELWQTIKVYNRAVPGSFDRGRDCGLEDALRSIEVAMGSAQIKPMVSAMTAKEGG